MVRVRLRCCARSALWLASRCRGSCCPGLENYFRHRVALSDDVLAVSSAYEDGSGRCVGLVGAPFEDGEDDSATDSRSAYPFAHDANWAMSGMMRAVAPGQADFLGAHVSCTLDTASIGARHDDGVAEDSGAVYVLK